MEVVSLEINEFDPSFEWNAKSRRDRGILQGEFGSELIADRQ